ncbi:hypothetical protein STEG23_036206 [Scotinomys teguina]
MTTEGSCAKPPSDNAWCSSCNTPTELRKVLDPEMDPEIPQGPKQHLGTLWHPPEPSEPSDTDDPDGLPALFPLKY